MADVKHIESLLQKQIENDWIIVEHGYKTLPQHCCRMPNSIVALVTSAQLTDVKTITF